MADVYVDWQQKILLFSSIFKNQKETIWIILELAFSSISKNIPESN